jgi:ribosomal protein L37AE/L43A
MGAAKGIPFTSRMNRFQSTGWNRRAFSSNFQVGPWLCKDCGLSYREGSRPPLEAIGHTVHCSRKAGSHSTKLERLIL